jgi:putative transposase
MRGPYTQLYLHYVWATWDRLPLIQPEYESQLYNAIASKCRSLKCEPLAIGGIEDHIHLLVRFSPALSPASFIGEVKGSSSHLMTHEIRPGVFFQWQGAYGAFTLRKGEVETVTNYVMNQKAHHANNSLIADWETFDLGETLQGTTYSG